MPLGQKHIRTGTIDQQKDSLTRRQYSFTTFPDLGTFAPALGYGSPAGTTGIVNLWTPPTTQGGDLPIRYTVLGPGQTLLAPALNAAGLGVDVSLDLTDNDGALYHFGGSGNTTLGLKNKHLITVGSFPGRVAFAKLSLIIADVSGTDEMVFGWHKLQADPVSVNTYSDYAGVGIYSAANPASVRILTRLNSGTQVNTDSGTTLADTIPTTWEMEIRNDGTTRFLIDGALRPAAGTGNAGFTYDNGDQLVPFFFGLHATTAPGLWTWRSLEIGFREQRLN